MSMEGDLFNLFKHMDFGSMRPTDIMARLLQQYELGILQMLKEMVDTRIDEIAKAQAKRGAAGVPDDLNPFNILGIGMDATEAEVKAAYRKRAAEAHPDRGGSDMEMKKVNAAYEVICKFHGWSK